MRSRGGRLLLPLLLVLATTGALADHPFCGNGPETEQMLQRMAERSGRMRIGTDAAAPMSLLQGGTFFIEADEQMLRNHHPLDLAGSSLVFEPRANAKFAVRRTALQYVEPTGDPIVFADASFWFRKVDLQSFSLPLFGRTVTSVYVTAYNGIHLDAPAAELEAMQVDALAAAVHRDAVLSPLLFSKSKPRNLVHPDTFVNETADGLVVTWRSSKSKWLGFDLQAQLRRDGSVVYSYKTIRNIEWGAPILSPGFGALNPSLRLLGAVDDPNDVPVGADGSGAMMDITRFEVLRVGESDLLLYRLKVAKPIDPKLVPEGQLLRFWVISGVDAAQIHIEKSGATNVYAPGRSRYERNAASARYSGDTIEMYVTQDGLGLGPGAVTLRAGSIIGVIGAADNAAVAVTLDAPAQRIASDLSSTSGAELTLPITEPFVLGALDVSMVWRILKTNHGMRDEDIDGLAIYQSMYTDILFYAGAYSTVGNPQVDGIGSRSGFGTSFVKSPALLHMNQFTYGYNGEEKSASQVALHEFGHRWLYHTAIRVDGTNSRVLNPLSAHPAQYVHMPAAFKIYDDEESSTMGGAFFRQQGDGTWIARVRNAGFSWAELYLMGLAARSEVQPWFFLDGTEPKLGGEYWPLDKQVVTGVKKDVTVDQIIAAAGERRPSAALSQQNFRVPFVLVTYPGRTATAEQIAQMNFLRGLFERNFAIATGERASVTTKWPLARRRSTR